MREFLLTLLCLLVAAAVVPVAVAGWLHVRAILIHCAMSFVASVDEELLPRSVVLWYAKEDQKLCRFLGENIESRYTIARENARYL